MKEETGDLWKYHNEGKWIVITTNGTVKKNGLAVMGRGIALEAALLYDNLSYVLGQFIYNKGNHVRLLTEFKIIAFPVKHNWWEKADLGLIERSTKELFELKEYMKHMEDIMPLYLVRPGCGAGQLSWDEVKPVLEKYLDDDFVVVEKNV